MLRLLTAFLLLVSFIPNSFGTDTVKVRSHDRLTVVTDPVKGFNRYPARVVFPKGPSFRKVLLTVTLGCPDGMRCADWDYLDRVYVHPAAAADTIELARVLTPYGGGFGRDWSWTWTAEVTDLAGFLDGEAEVIYEHTGYEPNQDRGWALTLELAFVKGPPAAQVLAVQPLYEGQFTYGDPSRSIEAELVPRTVPLPAGATAMELRIHQTGHGMHADDGCGEFCAKHRYVKVQGDTVNARRLWKECGSNPLRPQAGTWIFDRANWCPGELHEAEHVAIPSTYLMGSSLNVDLDMEPYRHDSSTAVQSLTAYAVVYGRPRAQNDVSVDAVELPGPRMEGSPACLGARVRIRNRGGAPLRSVLLRYGTDDLPRRTFEWRGELPFNATAEVDLAGALGGGPGSHRFTVEASRPNGGRDGWTGDDRMSVPFRAPNALPGKVVAQLRTNAEPGHNHLRVIDGDGGVVLTRALGTLRPDTLYSDTLLLAAGCYTLLLGDTAGDGLEFWYNWKGGRGTLRLVDGEGRLLRDFQSDFGNTVYHPFRVDPAAVVVPDTVPAIGLFPTRTTGRTVLDYFANAPADITVRVIDEQQNVVEEHRYEDLKEAVLTYDLGRRPPQRYTLKVLDGGRELFSRRLRVVDRLD